MQAINRVAVLPSVFAFDMRQPSVGLDRQVTAVFSHSMFFFECTALNLLQGDISWSRSGECSMSGAAKIDLPWPGCGGCAVRSPIRTRKEGKHRCRSRLCIEGMCVLLRLQTALRLFSFRFIYTHGDFFDQAGLDRLKTAVIWT